MNQETIPQALRRAYPEALAVFMSRWRDLDLAEDCLQEASLKAIKEWQTNGVPEHARAWLLQVAQRLAIDHYRKTKRWDKLTPLLAHSIDSHVEMPSLETDFAGDELLKLIFTCCHPAIAIENQVALALKSLLGFSVPEISSALLQKEKTIEQRLTRAKRKISTDGIAYEVPPSGEVNERIQSALSVIYLLFNEGYCSNSNAQPLRKDLCDQAIALTQSLLEFEPNHGETKGLLALMLGHRARDAARLTQNGEWIRLEEQNRSLWNHDYIRLADSYLTQALSQGNPGSYQLQAAIIALHNQAPSFSETDWTQILLLYNLLVDISPGPIVRINRIVALWYALDDPATALDALKILQTEFVECQGIFVFHLTHGHLLEALKDRASARLAYKKALDLAKNSGDKKVLIKKINLLSEN